MHKKTFCYLNLQTKIKEWIRNTHFYRDNDVILREFKYFWKALLLGIGFSVGASLLEGAGIGLLISLLHSLTGESSSSATSQKEWAWIDTVLGVGQELHIRILRVSGLILLTTLVRATFMYAGARNMGAAQISLLAQLRTRIFDQLATLHLSFFDKSRSGDLVNILTTEINAIRVAASSIAVILSRGVYLPIYLIFVSLLSVKLALTVTLLLLLLPIALIVLSKKVKEMSLEVTQSNKLLAGLIVEFISGIRVIQSFAAQPFEQKRFQASVQKLSLALDEQNHWSAMVDPLGEFIGVGVIVITLTLGYTAFQLTVANLLAFIYILLRLVQNLRVINLASLGVSQLYGSAKAIKWILEKEGKPYINSGYIHFSGFSDSICFEDTKFGYSPNHLVINSIDLKIKKGQTVAFVGSSGSGKSTLVSLLLRLYEPISGRILIDGRDVADYEIASLRNRMAIVSQDTFLFNASVRENISYGLEYCSEAEILNAARIAFALEFIEQLPEGLDTPIGDRGVKLSGGQRQRIAIARAILRDPEILILDEATSSLDNTSEKIVQQAINYISKDRTVLAIAHRISTVVDADIICVVEKGKIVEKGNYNELMANSNGKFWKMSTQVSC